MISVPLSVKCIATVFLGGIWTLVWIEVYAWAPLSVHPVSLFACATVVLLHEMWRTWGD